MPKPTIAMMRGPAAGAGVSLAAACDFRLTSDNATFTSAFARVGVSGDYGGSYFLTRLLGVARAREFYLLGDRIDAADALRIGLVNRVFADSDLERKTELFAARLAAGPPLAYRFMKHNLNIAETGALGDVLDIESRNMVRTQHSADSREAVKAFLEKRPPSFRGV